MERWELPYVVSVFLGAGLAAGLSFAQGADAWTACYRGLVLLVAASPCAVVIATPAAVLSAITHAAHHGVLFKGGVHLERLAQVTALALDKTGTVTEGRPRVLRVTAVPPATEEDLLRYAAAVEARSEHHTGRAVVAEATRRRIAWPEVTEFKSHIGEGVHAHADGRWIGVGRDPLPPRRDRAGRGGTRSGGDPRTRRDRAPRGRAARNERIARPPGGERRDRGGGRVRAQAAIAACRRSASATWPC